MTEEKTNMTYVIAGGDGWHEVIGPFNSELAARDWLAERLDTHPGGLVAPLFDPKEA